MSIRVLHEEPATPEQLGQMLLADLGEFPSLRTALACSATHWSDRVVAFWGLTNDRG